MVALQARVGLRASLARDDGGAEATERADRVMAWKRLGPVYFHPKSKKFCTVSVTSNLTAYV